MKPFIRPQAAVEYLRDVGFSIGRETLQAGLQQRVFPFGDYIHSPVPGGQDVYSSTRCCLPSGPQSAARRQSRRTRSGSA